MIGIICAMEIELQKIKSSMKNIQTEEISSINFHSGEFIGKDCVVAVSGVGKVNAAACAQTMILKYNPEFIINVGVAGGLLENMQVYDIAISKNAVQSDVDTSALGDPKGFISTIEIINLPCSQDLASLILNKKCEDRITIHYGTIASSDKFIADKKELQKIRENFDAIACDMETASIAQVCYLNSTKFLSIRVISDNINNENSHLDYEKFKKTAANKGFEIIKNLINEIK